jgi:hypothetical protein
MFQRALSIAGEGRAIEHGDHDPHAGMQRGGLGGGVQTDQERRGIGIARGERRVVKRLFHFLGAHARIDALRIGTAGAPEFDKAAGGLQPVAGRGGRGVRGLPRGFLGTGAEYKREETLLGVERGSQGHGQQQGRFPGKAKVRIEFIIALLAAAAMIRAITATARGAIETTLRKPRSARRRSSTARREIPAAREVVVAEKESPGHHGQYGEAPQEEQRAPFPADRQDHRHQTRQGGAEQPPGERAALPGQHFKLQRLAAGQGHHEMASRNNVNSRERDS